MRDDKPKGDVSPRVLVVEDEENVRDLLLEVLAENGYRVEAVRTGEELSLIHISEPTRPTT